MAQVNRDDTQTQQVYQYLKDAIYQCRYLPGQELSEKQLFEELPFGRTPIREAILRLQNEELISIWPRRGMQVAPITDRLIGELYQTRKLIEPAIASTWYLQYSKRDLLNYSLRLPDRSLSDEEFYRLDTEFHTYLVSVTGNRKLIGIFEDLMRHQYRMAVYAARMHKTTQSDNDPEHARIIQAILDEDPAEIKAAVTHHINRSMLETMRCLEEENG